MLRDFNPLPFCLLPSALCLASTTNINANLLTPAGGASSFNGDASVSTSYKRKSVPRTVEVLLRLEEV